MHMPTGMQPYFKAIAYLGMMALIGDAWLSIKFGWSIAAEMAVIAGVVSVASGLLLVVAMFFSRIGWSWLGRGLAVVWACSFAFNVWSNMGVSTANRMGEVQAARVQQTNYKEQQANVEEAKRSLELFQKQLASLLEQNAWAGTVTADGLRAQVEDLRKAEVAEARLGGCGPNCRRIQNKITDVQGQIAVAEQRSKLTDQIAATRKVIEKNRTVLAGTDKGISSTANQSTLYAKLISFNLASDPSADMVTVANESTGIGFAVILAMIATGLTLAGAWPHLYDTSPASSASDEPVSGQFVNRNTATPPVEPARAYASLNLSRVTVGDINREKLRRLLDNSGLKAA